MGCVVHGAPAGVVSQLDLGARLQEQLHRVLAADEDGEHQWRPAAGARLVDVDPPAAEQVLEDRPERAAHGVQQRREAVCVGLRGVGSCSI